MAKRGIPDKPEWFEAIKLARSLGPLPLHTRDGAVVIGESDGSGLPAQTLENIKKSIYSLYPWRKGPFEILGHRVDASWKSDLKWDRILELLKKIDCSLEDKWIADVGANNGYYMFRMLEHNPAGVLGIDPVGVMAAQFEFLKSLHPHPALGFVRAGFEHLENHKNYFDIIFNMGILYHHTDPVQILRLSLEALKGGGLLILETMGIPGEEGDGNHPPLCLFPEGKYAGANGIWFLPDPAATVAMLKRAGFSNIQLHNVHTYEEEMQFSNFSNMPDLKSFLDPEDPSRTVEGYPAPVRILVSAWR